MSNKKPTPFDVINALSEIRPLTYNDLLEKGPYDTFLINRSLSLSEDTTFIAAILNERSFLDKDVQANFIINTVRPRRRWSKWPKTVDKSKDQLVANYYGISLREAKLYSGLHSEKQLQEMSKILDTGQKVVRGF